jgi:hypothetical protein
MSKIALTPSATGTGVFSILSPATNTDRSLTLPDEAGTVLTSASTANFPAGSVLQMANLVYSTQSSLTVGTTDTDMTGMTLSITPKGTGSKFRIDVRLFAEMETAWNIVFNVQRGSTRINTTSDDNNHGLAMATQTFNGGTNDDSSPEILTLFTIDSTGSTAGTPITYKLVAACASTKTLWINRGIGGTETGISEIIITEIGG